MFRHLLVDITGSTHRAELCIDKLFSPDSERGRLGLLELRGFEMPPHPRMALVQALLVRALVARFWAAPYAGPLVRWGTELHDRFLLPWYVAADITEVVDDLARHGFSFDAAWVAPFLEFRFPRIGAVEVDGVTLELRTAIEPWSVLGEEVSSTGTARYVDSSVERLQVSVDGFTVDRHLVTCNGVPVPLHTTGTPGGLRRRSALPGVEAAVRPAPHHRCPRPPRLRSGRPVERAFARRVHVPREPSRRAGVRAVPRQRQRGGGPTRQSFLRRRAHRRARSMSKRSSLPARRRGGLGAHSQEYPRTLDLRRAPVDGKPAPPAELTGKRAAPHDDRTARPTSLLPTVKCRACTTRCSRPTGGSASTGRTPAHVIGNLGLDELLHRRSEARRLLDDDGVTYNIYGPTMRGDDGSSRGLLGPGPRSGAAREQRMGRCRARRDPARRAAQLGPHRSLRPPSATAARLLPAELVLGHAGFLRQCDQIRLARATSSCSLWPSTLPAVRRAVARCWPTSHRHHRDAGYALENRVVVSRVLPSLYRDSQVHRLAPFFRTLRASLQDVAPPDADDPRIVLLSPGPWSETAFEHAYLASTSATRWSRAPT